LVLFQHFLGVTDEESAQELFFDGCLHLGTLVAVLLYFIPEFLKSYRTPAPPAGFRKVWPDTCEGLIRLAILVAVASIPAAAITLIKSEAIKDSFKNPKMVAGNFLILGGILLFVSRSKQGAMVGLETKWWQAL